MKRTPRTGFVEDDSDAETVKTESTVPTWTSDKDYDVEDVLAEKVENGVPMFLLSWVGYSLERATWEPAEDQNETIHELWTKRQRLVSANLQDRFDHVQFEAQRRKKEDKKMTERAIKRWRKGLPLASVDYVQDEKPQLFEDAERGSLMARPKPLKKGVAQTPVKKSTQNEARPILISDSDSDSEDSEMPLMVQQSSKKALPLSKAKASDGNEADQEPTKTKRPAIVTPVSASEQLQSGLSVAQPAKSSSKQPAPSANAAAEAAITPNIPSMVVSSKAPGAPPAARSKKSAHPLFASRRQTEVKKPFAMTYSDPKDAVARKRKSQDATSVVPRFANLKHQNNTLKKQRRENDRIPAAQDLALRSLSIANAATVVHASTNAVADKMDVDHPTAHVSLQFVPSPTSEENAASLSQEQHYKQHSKPPGFIPLTCPFWASRSSCPKGTGCFFLHSSKSSEDRVASQPLWQQAESESRSQSKFEAKFGFFIDTVICPHWRSGGCHHADENCWYAHWQPLDGSTRRPTLPQTPIRTQSAKFDDAPLPLICYYWAAGSCNRSEQECNFRHHPHGIIAIPLHLQRRFPDWRESLHKPTLEEFERAKVAGRQDEAFLKQQQDPPTVHEKNRGDLQVASPADGSIHPERLALLSGAANVTSRLAKPTPTDATVTEKINMVMLAHNLSATWTLPSRIYDVYAQGGESHDIMAVEYTDLKARAEALEQPLASGRLSELEGDLPRFEDLFFWMKMYFAAIWMPIKNSTIGILIVCARQDCWSFLPEVPNQRSKETTQAELLFYVYKQHVVQDAVLLNIPEQLATMDTCLGQLKSLIPEGHDTTEYFLGRSTGSERKALFISSQESEWSRLMWRFFQKADFDIFFDFPKFMKYTANLHAGAIIIDAAQPTESIRRLKGLCYCFHAKAGYNIFSMGSTDESTEHLQCVKWNKSGMTVFFTADSLLQCTASALDIVEQIHNLNTTANGQARKLILPCPILQIISVLLEHAGSKSINGPDKEDNALLSVKRLHEVLTHFERNTGHYDAEKPLLINPRGNNALMIDDETTIADYCQSSLLTLQTYRQAIVVCSKQQMEQVSIRFLIERNQHVRFYTAEEFAQKLRTW